jgi:predicted phosphodiesterase
LKIGVISDIHGNCVALDSVLSDLASFTVDRTVCLGDAIQGGSQPGEVVARLRERNIPTVMGNADYWLLTDKETSQNEKISEKEMQVRSWSLSKLSKADNDFIRSFEPVISIPLGSDEKKNLVCFHGSPNSFDEVILPTTTDEELGKMISGYDHALLCGGHTHLQQIRGYKTNLFFNPGSVGFAFDRSQKSEETFRADPWAEYAVVSVDAKGNVGIEFRRVPFDVEEWTKVTIESGRPYADLLVKEYSRD